MRVDSKFFYVLSILKYNFDPFFCLWSWFLLLTILFTALPANRHTLAPGILGFLIMRVSECCKCHLRDSKVAGSRPSRGRLYLSAYAGYGNYEIHTREHFLLTILRSKQ
jgi:hypothetical protein